MDALSDLAFATDDALRGYDFIATHCGHGVFRRLPSSRRLIVLREPVERVISYYYYLRGLESDSSYAGHYAKMLSLADFVSQTNPAVSVGVADAQLWHLIEDKNFSFRQRYPDLSDDAKVALALTNLESYEFVGFHDGLEALFTRLVAAFGWLDGERPWLAPSKRPSIDLVDEGTLNLIRERVSLDSALYAAARLRYAKGL